MGKLGDLWFDVGLKDMTDRNYETIRKKLEKGFVVTPKIDDSKLKDALTGKMPTLNITKIAIDNNALTAAINRKKIKAEISDLIVSQKAFNSLGRQIKFPLKAKIDIDRQSILDAIKDVEKQLPRINIQVGATANQSAIRRDIDLTTSAFGRQNQILHQLRNQISNYVSIYAVERFLRNVIEIGGEFEKQKIALTSILGEASKAEAVFSRIKSLAVESPFEFKDLSSYTKQLSAFSIPYEELFDTTKRLADISAGLGVDMGRIILAYGQVRSAAFLRGQELRQFTEAGIPLVDELANKFSKLEGKVVSAGDVFQRISDRMVSFEMVKDVLWNLTSEGGKFFNMQEQLADSLAGKLSNLKDSFHIMLSEIADGNSGILSSGIDGVRELMENWRQMGATIIGVAGSYTLYRGVVAAANTIQAISIIRQHGLTAAVSSATAALTGQAVAINNVNAANAKSIIGINKITGGLGKFGGIAGISIMIIGTLAAKVYAAYVEANKLKTELDEVIARAQDRDISEVGGLNVLIDRISKAAAGTKERADLINEMNTRYGNYLPKLIEEADSNEKIASSIDSITEAIRRKNQAQAYEEGMAKIESDYTSKERNIAKDMETALASRYGFDKESAKKLAKDLIFSIKEAGKDADYTSIVKKITSQYGKELDKILSRDEVSQWGVGASYTIEVDFVKELIKLSGERLKNEQELTGELNAQFAGVRLYADQLKAIQDTYAEIKKSSPNNSDIQKSIDISEIEAEIDLLKKNKSDFGSYYNNLLSKLESLKKETPGWIKEVEKLHTKAGNDPIFNFTTPQSEEQGDVLKYLNRISEVYKKINEEIKYRSKIGINDTDNKKQLEKIKRQKKLIDEIGKSLQVDFSVWENKKAGQDTVAEKWKERINLLKEAYSIYDKFKDIEGNSKAGKRVDASGLIGNIIDGGFSKEKYINELDNLISEILEKAKTSKQKDALNDAINLRVRVDEESVKEALEGMAKHISEWGEKWKSYKNLFDATGNRTFAMNVVFGGDVGVDKFVDDLKNKLQTSLKDSGISLDEILKMSQKDVDNLFGGKSRVAVLFSAIRKEQEKNNQEELSDLQEVISKYQDYITKRENAERKFREDRKKLKENGASDEQIAENKFQEEEALTSIDEAFAMRSEQFEAWSNEIVNWSLSKLERMLDLAKDALAKAEAENPQDPNLAKSRAAVSKLETQIKKVKTNPDKKSTKEWKELYEVLNNVSDAFKSAGEAIGGTAGELIGTTGEVASTSVQLLQGIKTIQAGVQGLETASVILAVISAAIQIGTKIASFFTGKSSYEKYEETKEVYEAYIEVMDKVIDKQLELAESMSSENARKAYDEAVKAVKLQEEAARVMGKQYLDSAKKRSHTYGYKEVKNMTSEGWKQAANAMGVTVEKFKEMMGGRMTGLFDLTASQLETLMVKSPIFFANLDEDTRKYINQIVDGSAKIEEIQGSFNEMTTGIGLKDLSDEFAENLSEMSHDAGEFSKDFEGKMRKAIARSLVYGEAFQKKMKDWYNNFTNAAKSGDTLDKDEVDNLRKEWDDLVKEAVNKRDQLFAAMGFKGEEGKDDDGLVKGVQNLTEDTGSLIASYMNGIRADVSMNKTLLSNIYSQFPRINVLMQAQLIQLSNVARNTLRNADMAEEIYELLRNNIAGVNKFNI